MLWQVPLAELVRSEARLGRYEVAGAVAETATVVFKLASYERDIAAVVVLGGYLGEISGCQRLAAVTGYHTRAAHDQVPGRIGCLHSTSTPAYILLRSSSTRN